jgi:hypothetical protein
MGASLPTFEVRVKVKSGSKRYQSFLGTYVQDEMTRMFHKEARSGEQAMQKCEKYGRPVSARKVDRENIQGHIENLKLDQPQENPYENAIAMDEMIWRKRNIRRDNLHKDKPNY